MNHFNKFLMFSSLSAFFGFAHVLIAPVLAPYIKSLGFTDFQVALIFSMFGFSLIFVSPILGRISDQIGRRRVILFGLFVMITSMMLYTLGNSWLTLVLGRIFEAIGSAAVGLIALAKVEDYLKNKERGTYTGLNQSINQVGIIAAPLVGGYLGSTFGPRTTFGFSAAMVGILLLMMIFWRAPHKKKIHKADFNLLNEWKSFWNIQPLRAMAILGCAVHGSGSVFWIFLPIFLVEQMGISYSSIGYMIFAMGIFQIFQFYFGRLADRWGRRKFILSGVLLLGISATLLSVATEFYHVILIALVHSLGSALFNTAAWTFMSDIAEEVQHEGEYLGSYLSFAKMGSFSFQILAGVVITFLGYRSYFFLNGILALLLLGIAVRYIQKPAQP